MIDEWYFFPVRMYWSTYIEFALFMRISLAFKKAGGLFKKIRIE